MQPLHLDVRGRRVVVAGGGPLAAGCARDLAALGADVLVVAVHLCEELAEQHDAGAVRWREGGLTGTDLDGAWLVHAATGDAREDDAVAALAEQRRLWCVRPDAPAAGTAVEPAVVRRDDVVLSVDAGADTERARAVAVRLGHLLDSGAAPLRRHRPRAGRVVLVGGGPGEPELLTLRGRRRLAEADVVVVDRLAPTGVLAELDPDVEVVDVGKTSGKHPVPQEEINRVLVDAALAGRTVVRLKGGDPYVLGRGGEEVLACRQAGVEVEVVPGVTSAFAVPAAAGIPVTHRGAARCVTVLSGHEDLDGDDLGALARLAGTLVVLMGVAALDRLAAGLLAAGRDPATPVAVVQDGWTPRQRTTTAPLADIARVARRAGVQAPAVVVVGEVVDVLGPGPGAP
ncbi:uroporphyrinogen-III C-methyltransferase [Paenibacillus sp. TRM 82003]|uniref:uroporphyrinogen-III C-methyltransferase n=1 Tax=Kineococcus sp. TRM81007 TaxID=2925831 RepID=UPI001F57FB28|nr:uroporphyrinogen-III C-methyltransferase [Kineococcus sp. TRM81007]MCI2240704.1 uroporphyrinogen-III C-methyltransferase [Kineococcus sp. TRM81007]MCI3925374.1 uroporphyrinogen-III C-methyltransferase [Paenibacillus sp. TRM 82003]